MRRSAMKAALQVLIQCNDHENYGYDSEDDDDEEPEPKMGEVPKIDDEPGIAVESQLSIKEQSAKAIDILASHLHS
jgi:hypothetical protein